MIRAEKMDEIVMPLVELAGVVVVSGSLSHPMGKNTAQEVIATKLKSTALFIQRAIPKCNWQIKPTAM